MPPKVEQTLVLGSGPAAYAGAIYLARAALAPLVLTGSPSRDMIPGGQLMWTTEVENFPGFPDGITGQDLMGAMEAQARRFGTRLRMADATSLRRDGDLWVVETDDDQGPVSAKGVIIATGARARWLGVPGEERMAREGRGVSACAVCDGAMPAFRGATIYVVGGGDSAMEEALYLQRYASEVVLVHRRAEFRASKVMADRVLTDPRIRVEWNTEVVEVLGEEFLEGLRLRDVESGEHRVVSAGGLFVAIGHIPNTAFLGDLLPTDPNGYLIVDERGWTGLPNLYAAGDVHDPIDRQAITAAGAGCRAALALERALSHG